MNDRARRLLSAIATTSAAAALVLEATGAAHAAPRPPKLAGYVSYSSVTTTVACTAGVPTSVTFSAGYDASHLTGTPTLDVFGHLVDGSTDFWYDGIPGWQPTPGSTGTYTTTFQVDRKVSANAVITTDIERNGFVYASRTVPLTCASANAATVTAPALTASPVNCDSQTTLTFDGAASAQDWTYGAFDVTEGLRQPGDTVLRAGRSTTVTQRIVPGDDLEFRVLSPSAILDLGGVALTSSCTQAVLGQPDPTDNSSAGDEQTVTVYLTNQNGSPAKHKAVSYQVSGANSASGTTQTDGNGKATFTYAAKHAGLDTLTATFGKSHATVKYTIARRAEHPRLSVSHRGGRLVATVATKPIAKNVTVALTATVGKKHVSESARTNSRGVATFALPRGLGVEKVVTKLKSRHGHASVRTALKHVTVSLSAQVVDRDYDPTPSNTVTTKG